MVVVLVLVVEGARTVMAVVSLTDVVGAAAVVELSRGSEMHPTSTIPMMTTLRCLRFMSEG